MDYMTDLIAPIIFIGSPAWLTIGLIIYARHHKLQNIGDVK